MSVVNKNKKEVDRNKQNNKHGLRRGRSDMEKAKNLEEERRF